jgi:uncharacterized protein (TIGR00645 family)
MSNKIEHTLESSVFYSRWLLAPFYVGLIVSIVLLLIKFMQELWHIILHILHMSDSDTVIAVLTLVDMSLVASLLLMIIFSGYEIFISKIHVGDHEDKPDWMGKVDFSGLKLKLIGAIVAISAIDLLKTFMNIPEVPTASDEAIIMWKVIIHMAFVLSGVFLPPWTG